MKKEFSADGRNDNGFAPVFKLDNIFFPQEIEGSNENNDAGDLDNIWIGDWNDLRELTSVNFALDALLTSCGEHWEFITFFANPSKGNYSIKPNQYSHLLNLIVESTLKPEQAGINPFEEHQDGIRHTEMQPTPSLGWAIEEFALWRPFLDTMRVEKAAANFNNEKASLDFRLEYYNALLIKSISELDKQSGRITKEFARMNQQERDELRIKRAVPLAVLVSLHNRLDGLRFSYKRSNHKFSNLFTDLEAALVKYLRFG